MKSLSVWNHVNWGALQAKHGVEPAALAALIEVESNGRCFDSANRPLVRFERHVAWRVLVRLGVDPDTLGASDWLLSPTPSGRGCASAWVDWSAYQRFRSVGPQWQIESAAIQACSWGFAQILGEGYQSLGYETAGAFRLDQNTVEGQLHTFLAFLDAGKFWPLLREHKWDTVAARYNGRGHVSTYSILLSDAYRRYRTIGVPKYPPAPAPAPPSA